MPVASLAAVTVAPSIAAPDASVTWPEIEPVEIAFWACALTEAKKNATDKIAKLQSVFILDPPLSHAMPFENNQELPQIRYLGKV
jgi:hypothetical protein